MSTWVTRVARGTRTRWWPEARAGTAQDVTKPGEDRGNCLGLPPEAKEWHRVSN